MNERIRELSAEAGLQPFEDCGPGYVYKMEKFAELIVLECCKEITQEPFNAGAASLWLKQHFGVEEQETVPPSPKCSVCGTTENVKYVGGFQPYLCNSVDCIPF